MGMSTKKIDARRDLPWPRYRVSVWDERAMCWRDLPQVYYSAGIAAGVGSLEADKGNKVRVCTLHADGRKVDMLLAEFEKQVRG